MTLVSRLLSAVAAALSRACHYHRCELAPTATELTRWLNETADLVTLIQMRAQA
jgi:hypothetical protein